MVRPVPVMPDTITVITTGPMVVKVPAAVVEDRSVHQEVTV
jgi:hypothetical protein